MPAHSPALSPARTSPAPTSSVADMRDVIAPFTALEGPLLPMLHALQETYGCVPDTATELLAETLNVSRAEVHGVISFYHDFKALPAKGATVKLCRAEACQARGSKALEALAAAHEGQSVTVEPVYCLGLCANGPAALVNGAPRAGLTEDAFKALLEELEA